MYPRTSTKSFGIHEVSIRNFGVSHMAAENHCLRFGDFVLDTDERTLTRKGKPVSLSPKALRLLSVLVERRGHIVEKDDLMQQVWTDTFVEEGNLAYTIRLLRKTLGDDPDTPKFIETIPRRGYRFVAECHPTSRKSSGKKLEFAERTFRREIDDGLIGREKELTDITQLLLTDAVRLVTLTGPGGTGKTRLAQEVANHVQEYFPDGVIVVDLSSVTDPMVVTPTIAQQLGIREVGIKPILDVLSDYLRQRSPLLILDNFEQVVSAGVELAQLSRNALGLKMLVTSREPLKLTIETEYRIQPLALPLHETRDTIADVMRFGAVQLFVERAKTARPDLELSDKDARTLVGICTKLDGLPLALELAASRAKVLSIQEISSRLEDRLALLTGGSRDTPDRQQTVRATIEWSYGLLNELDKRVFALLSVFEGGFHFKAAETVLTKVLERKSLLATDILNAITSLTEKGLLLSEKSVDNELRFRMLVVVRDYALELRLQSDVAQSIRRSHTEYFVEFAEAAAPHLISLESREWLDRLYLERDNIRAAMRWSLENQPDMAARIMVSVRHLAAQRLHVTETQYWLEEVLKKSCDISPYLQCEMLTGLGIMSQYQSDYSTARETHKRALALSRMISDKRLVARALRGIGAIDYMESDSTSARKRLSEALDISRSINDEFGEAAALARLGDVSNAEGDYSRARPLILQGLEIFRRLGFKQGVVSKLVNLAINEFLSGDHKAARQHLLEAMELCVEIGDEMDFRINFEIAAALMVEAGDYRQAARLAGVGTARCEEMAYFHEPDEKRFRSTYMPKLKSAMPEQEFDVAFAEGKNMSLAEARELAFEAARGPEGSSRRLHLVRG